MHKYIEQCKGKDLTKVTKSFIPHSSTTVFHSTKYDGNYIQVHVDNVKKEVSFFTSGGKEFYVHNYAMDFLHLVNLLGLDNLILETEWIGNTPGLLGDREKSQGIITTWRTEFNKRLISRPLKEGKFVVFDVITSGAFMSATDNSNNRLNILKELKRLNSMLSCIIVLEHTQMTYAEARHCTKQLVKQGYEGGYIKLPTHKHHTGKRVNDAIKDKPRPTFDLLCIGTVGGNGKYAGEVGSLILKDSKGRTVAAGSGLNDMDRVKNPKYFVGKVFEIEAERVNNSTYIQPVIKCERADKSEKDID